MAIHAHSTPMPAPQRGLLRRALDLATVEAEFASLIAQPWPDGISVQSDPKLAVPNQPENIGLDAHYLDTAGVSSRLPSTVLFARIGENRLAKFGEQTAAPFELPEIGDLKTARALHMRRELHQALDFGFALLDALDLSPRGLDIIDGAIARLDAMDAPDDDLEEVGDAEPSLGWTSHIYQTAFNIGDTADIELDMVDWEDGDPAEETSLETFGRGFVRCGADDDEDGFDIEEQHDAEQTYEDGSEDEPHPWRCDPSLVAFAVQVAHG